jgi:sugar lactone lactonase YvrE
MTTRSWIRQLFARTPRRAPQGSRRAPPHFRPTLDALEDRLTPSTLGTTALLEGPAAGSDSDVVSSSGGWSASSNAPSWLHTSAAGTGSGLATFTFDANPGATRSGTLTIAGLTLTVTQAGSTYVAAKPLTLASGLNFPSGVAVDGAGNVYIAETFSNAIEEWHASTQTVSTLVSSGLYRPDGLAVDGAGNVFIADYGHNAIEEWHASTQTVSTLVAGVSGPDGVAVDGAGNVFIAGTNTGTIEEWNAATQTVSTLVSGLGQPFGVAVDGAGNVFFSDTDNNALKEWQASTQTVSTLVSSGLYLPTAVAVDGAGNVYITDTNNGAIKEWNAATQMVSTLVSGLRLPFGVAVDGAGNVFIGATNNHLIEELPRAFVPGGAVSEGAAAGTDALPPVLPATQSLSGLFAPSSDQPWLTVGPVVDGVVHFSFAQNSGPSRTAHVTVLGQQIPVNQAAALVANITVTGYSVTYDGQPHSATGTATGAGNIDLSADLSLGGTQHTGAGAYTDTWTFHDPTGTYHDASGLVSDTITPATLTITPAAGQSKVYGAAVPTLTYTASGFVNGDPASTLTGALGTAATAASPVGNNYAFTTGTLGAGSNYTVTLAASPPTFAVTPAPLTVTANDQTIIQGEALPAFTARYSGFVLGEGPSVLGGTLTFSTPATAGSPPGFYTITPGDLTAVNYAITFVSGTLLVGSDTSLSANFNGTAIPAGDYLWFSSVISTSGLSPTAATTVWFVNQAITIGSVVVPVPNASITYHPGTGTSTTKFTAGGWWQTDVYLGAGLSGNQYLSGLGYYLPNGLAAGTKNVTWSGVFFTDQSGVSLNWKWAAAVYANLPYLGSQPSSVAYNALAIKSVDDPSSSAYKNADHAGTPEGTLGNGSTLKSQVTGGATGGGGSNYTGGYSGTLTAAPAAAFDDFFTTLGWTPS